MGGSGRQSKSKGSSSQKGKKKEPTNLDYDHTQFIGKLEDKLYNRVWARNGAVIEREIDLVTLEDIGIGYLQDFTNRGWISLTIFKAESILTLYQEFMENIKHRLVREG